MNNEAKFFLKGVENEFFSYAGGSFDENV